MSKIMKQFRDLFTNVVISRKATSAIEFAIIAPVLAAIVIALADVATIATGVGEMQTAIRASIQYAMNGGTDMATAQTQGTNAWDSKPADGTLSATTACFCGAAGSDCQTPCADNTAPQKFITVTASGTLGGNTIKRAESITEKVRVR
jgi:Flp pilus assembly protein TadG